MFQAKKVVFLILLILVFFLVVGSLKDVWAAQGRPLEIDYPEIPGVTETPTTSQSTLPGYIRYIFSFSVIVAGLIAFAVLVYGGIRYITSLGNPAAVSDAKSRMGAGILGLVILLGSYILLTTINPQLTLLEIGKKALPGSGVILYSKADCPGKDVPEGEEKIDFVKYRSSVSNIGDFKVESVYLYHSGDETEVNIYPEIDWQGDKLVVSTDKKAGDCITYSETAKSLSISSRLTGVYLLDKDGREVFLGNESKFIDNLANLGIDNEAKHVRFVELESEGSSKFSVILHDKILNGRAEESECKIIHSTADQDIFEIGDKNTGYGKNIKPSSATVVERSEDYTGYVWLCKNRDCVEQGEGDILKIEGEAIKDYLNPQELDSNFNDEIKAIRIYPDYRYAVVAFEKAGGNNDDFKGTCQVLSNNIPDLIGQTPIGKCEPFLSGIFKLARYRSCISGVSIIPMQ